MLNFNRFKELCKENGLSGAYIANKLGKKRSFFTDLKNGKFQLAQADLEIIAAALHTTPAYLLGETDDPAPLPSGARDADMGNVAPLLGTVRAGLPMYAEENIEGYIPIMQTDGAKYFWLCVRGDSMNAAGIFEGDEILVRQQPEVENGQIAVVLVNGDEATVKRFYQTGNMVTLTPQSFNPAHQPQVYNADEVPVRVVGLVVECRKKF